MTVPAPAQATTATAVQPAAVQPAAISPAALPAGSAAPTQSGVFVPVQGRLVDTRDGAGGVAGPVAANTWVSIQVLGQLGIPSTGAKAVVVTLTAINAPTDSWTQLASNTDRPTTQTTNLYSGYGDILSNTSIVPIGTDGKIALRTSASQHYVIEVQGYFTTGDVPAPGGYVPILSSRVIDSRNGTGIPAGQWVDGDVKTVNLKNVAGIPNTAGAVFANVILVSQDPANLTPTLYPYPGGAADPVTPLHFRGGVTTGVGTTLDMNAAGQVSFRVGYSTSPVDVIIDVEGYFDGQASDSTYHSLASRIYDSRPGQSIPAGGTVAVQVAGVNGLPAASAELAGVTMNITAFNSGAPTTGWFRVYPSDEAEQPQSQVNYHTGADAVSNVIVVRPGTTDGKIIVHNLGTAPADLSIDVQGWFTNAHLLPPAVGTDGASSGSRGAASMVSHQLSDSAGLAWNPTNGNVVLTGRLMHVRGIGQDMNLSWRYNSLNDARPTLNVGRIESALRVNPGTGAVTYTAPDGGWYTFTAIPGGGYTMPPGMNASLTNPGVNEYRIRFNDSGVVNVYTDDGANYSLAYSIDANLNNPNTISYTYTNGVLSGTTDTQGRSVSYLYGDTRNLNQPSKITDQSLNRSVTFEYNGGQGRLSKVTDATGITTAFTYTAAGKLASYTDGRTTATSIEYGTSNKTTKITYGSGTSAQSIWTAAYPNATTSTLKDPNSQTATYTYNTARQVTSVLDPNGNVVSGVFDKHDNSTSSTDGLGDLTTSAYNTNNNLTSITSPAGASGGSGGDVSFTYSSATGDPLSNYQPATATNSEGKTTTVAYDANTHAPSITTKPGLTGTIKNYYQDDTLGTTCGAKPGSLCRTIDGQGNTTSHGYNSQGNPVTLTRPAPLGVVTNTFDAAGRIATTQDGKNQSATYTYDANDRLTQTRYGSSCVAASCVTYTYDANGNLATRTDASGTTTYTYDAQNRATSKTTGTITTNLTYDGASNILTFIDPTGTVAYKYDGANRLTTLAEPGGSCPATPAFPNSTKCTGFGYDKNNRRTTTTYPNGVKNTTTFDNAGRTTAITATNSSGTVLAKRAYTYTTGGTGKDGSLKKTTTTETNAVTTYSYDELNRLTSAVQGTTTETWGYDKNGNRVTSTKTGQPSIYSAYNAADQLCWTAASTGSCGAPPTGATSYTYDGNGNTTSGGAGTTNAFNVFDQVTSTTTGGSTTNFAYAGQRNDERTTSGNTNFLNGSLGITTQTTAGATTAFIRDPAGAVISMRTTAGSFYYTTDTLGSVILLTDSTQAKAATYTYDSWGNTTTTGTQANNNPWQYAGGYKDTTTGYTKFGARYYNPTTGRFTQPDPSGQEANTYLYARANPINNTDPTGLASPFATIVGALAGGVVDALIGVPLAVGLSPLISPLGGAAAGAVVGGCLGGAISAGTANAIDGNGTSPQDTATACGSGIAYSTGAVGAGSLFNAATS